MPSNVYPRGDSWCARRTVHGEQIWLGSHATEELALAAVEASQRIVVELPRRRPRRVHPPSEEQVLALAQAMPTEDLWAFTLTAAFSGLRLECEVARLEAGDFQRDGDGGRLHVRCGKGSKERWAVLLEPGLSALESVARSSGALLRNQRGRPFTRKSVNKRWVTVRRELGLEHVTFHDLRKFHATQLLDAGVSDIDVAFQLGHFDELGRPDPELVRRIYGFPDPMKALARVAAGARSTVAA